MTEQRTETTARPVGSRDGGSELKTRPARAALAAVGAGGAVGVASYSDVLTGWPGIALVLCVALAVPLASSVSKRILYVGILTFGWVPFLYWFPLPTGDFSRSGICIAAVAACVAGWVFASAKPGVRARRLLPDVRIIDIMPLSVAVVGVVIFLPLFGAFTSAQAVTFGLRGWDNSSHFNMTEMIRLHGVTVDRLAPPGDGSAWYFSNYPEAFHSVAAWVMELLVAPSPSAIQAEVSGYFNAVALITVASTVMVAAGICSLPALRSRPWIALPAVTGVAAAMLLGPGAVLLQRGYGNQFVALALTGAVILIIIPMRWIFTPLAVGAVSGAVSAVANDWILIVTLVIPAAVVAAVPFRRDRWSGTATRKIACIALGFAAPLGCLKAYLTVSSIDFSQQLSTHGGFNWWAGSTAAIAFAAIVVCSGVLVQSVRRRRRGQAVDGTAWRQGATVVVILTGVTVAAVFAFIQIRQVGTVTYYFKKYAISVAIVSAVILATVSVLAAARARIPRPQRRGWVPVVSIGLAFLAVLVFGSIVANGVSKRGPFGSAGLLVRAEAQTARTHPRAVAQDVVDAAAIQARYNYLDTRVVLVLEQSGAYHSTLLNFWVMALASDWTYRGTDIARDANPTNHGGSIEATALALATKYPDVVVVLADGQVARVRAAMPNDRLAERVIAVSTGGRATAG